MCKSNITHPTQTCIRLENLCDGEWNCLNGEDETDEICRAVKGWCGEEKREEER